MTITPVKTLEEAFAVALIRNECRQWMTGDKRILDVRRQLEFFSDIPHGTALYIVRNEGIPVGYAVTKRDQCEYILTGGIAEPFRGNGLGKKLFLDLVSMTKGRCKLSVFKHNKRAIHIYNGIGFKTYRETQKQLFMRYDSAS